MMSLVANEREGMINNVKTSSDIVDPMDVPVWGAQAIGKVIKRNTRMTYHLLETGAVPSKKIGGRFVSTPRALLKALTPEAV